MSTPEHPPERTPEEKESLDTFFRALKTADKESKAAAIAGLEALPRLVKACYAETGGQATVISAWLASRYNGSNAAPVRLDNICRLDWTLQKDLAAVVLGCGQIGFPDVKIREAFEALGGEDAVEELHWHTTGGPQKNALRRLIEHIEEHPASSSAKNLRTLLGSIVTGQEAVLSRLGYLDDDLTRDFCTVLSGLYGRDKGLLHVEDVQAALESSKIKS